MMSNSSDFSKKKKEKIIVFGTGSAAIKYVKSVRKTHQVVCYLDNDPSKHEKMLNGVLILPPDAVKKFPSLNVIVASSFFDEIYAQLKENKHFNQTNVIFYRSLHTDRSFIEKTKLLISNNVKNLICNIPQFLIPLFRTILNISHYQLVNISSLEDDHRHRVLMLRPEQKDTSVGPNFVDRTQNKINVMIPAVGLYQFYNCQISMLSRAFKTDSSNIIIETIHTISDKITKYNKGHLTHHYQDKLALVRNEKNKIIQKGILINGHYDKNYYHWIVDIIPQLQYIQELPDEYKDFPILISEMSRKIKSIKELVSLYNIEQEIIYLPSTSDYIVQNLLIISSPNRCCPRIIGSAWSLADYTYCRRENIHYVRDLVLKQCNGSIEFLPKRIFLAPSMKYRKYNQDDVFTRLEKFGFVIINPEQMGLIEQALIFNSAEVIVGPTGATWTNLIFAKHNANALCWMAEEWGDFSSFSNIADKVGVNLDYFTYVAGVVDHFDLLSQEYVISPQVIEDWVGEIIDN